MQKVKARPDLTLAFLPSNTVVKLRLQMKSENPNSETEFETLVEELKSYCGKDFFGFEPLTLQEFTIQKLLESKRTLALAESCTGGLVSHFLTQVPGSSAALRGTLIAYQDEVKIKELGVSENFIATHGAVSEGTVKIMAEKIRQKWNTDFGLATTGYIGPSGGDEHASLGTVWIALASASETKALKFNFEAHRERAKERAAQAAIDLLRRSL